jgi:hypothetical protein
MLVHVKLLVAGIMCVVQGSGWILRSAYFFAMLLALRSVLHEPRYTGLSDQKISTLSLSHLPSTERHATLLTMSQFVGNM